MTKIVLTHRLSPNFLLSDFLYGYENYSNMASTLQQVANIDAETIDRASRFCNEFLDPLVKQYGPVSIANGYRYGCKGPHQWNQQDGVAADVAFHNWVNSGNAPIRLLSEIDQAGTEYERMISYAGSEFVCLAWKPEGNNRAAFYENARQAGRDPLFITHGRSPADRSKRIGLPVRMRRDWRRGPGEPIYHCQRNLRAQHIRVSEFFTLLDMCRNVRAFAAGMSSVLPFNLFNSPRANVARMMGEVLDEVVRRHGQISVVRGLEPVAKRIKGNHELHFWNASMTDPVKQAQIVFAVDHDRDCIEPLLLADDRVAAVDVYEDERSVYYQVTIDYFEPAKKWSSATDNTGL